MNIQVFWDVMRHIQVQRYQRFEGACCLQLQGLRRLYCKYFGRFTRDPCCLNQDG